MTCIKFQIPNPKSQINHKYQYSMTKTMSLDPPNLAHWNLFVIWRLLACLPVGRGLGASY